VYKVIVFSRDRTTCEASDAHTSELVESLWESSRDEVVHGLEPVRKSTIPSFTILYSERFQPMSNFKPVSFKSLDHSHDIFLESDATSIWTFPAEQALCMSEDTN